MLLLKDALRNITLVLIIHIGFVAYAKNKTRIQA